tara:strand:+ start:1277 stop:1726 length:450 start_codon:yes stop_codon:yes gene_type:complete
MAKATQRQIVAEIAPVQDVPGHIPGPGFPKYFATVSGGEISAAVEKVYDGNSTFPEVLCAPAEIGDITVSKFYDPDDDGSKLNSLRQLVGMTYYDINIYTLNCELKEPGSERTYAKALLVGLTEPDGDAASGAPAAYSLTFSVSTVGAI